MSINHSSPKNLKSRNQNKNATYKNESDSSQQINNKKRAYSQINKEKRLSLAEKNMFSQKIIRNNHKNLTTLNTTRDNTIISEIPKKSIYYDKFINSRYSDFSEDEMQNKLNEDKNDDIQFLDYILYNIYNIVINNNGINKEKENKYKYDFNIIRKYIIKIETNFKKEAENIINKNKYNQIYFLIQYFLKKLHHLISRFAIIIFFFVQKKNINQAKIIFLLMLKENIIYINYIEKSIIEWYSTENKKINIAKEYPNIAYELLMIYSFIIKYSHFFNMNIYTTKFLGRYFDVINFIYNYFLSKANIREFNLDTKNKINLWFSLSLHHGTYFLISNYFPLNIPIYFNNHINKLYKNSDENNLTNNSKSLLLKNSYNLGLLYYLNGQNDKAISKLIETKDIIISTDESDNYQSSIVQKNFYKKISMPLFKQNYNNIINSNESLQLNENIETNRISTATSISDVAFNNNKNDFQNMKITKNNIKEPYLKNKINLEDIHLLINYGKDIGLLNSNGKLNHIMHISPNNKNKYLSIPEFFLNPFLRKIELLMGEIELSRKNYISAYDHILKTFYILISLRLNKRGSENLKYNIEKKIIEKYMQLIIPHNNEIENFDINLFNQSTLNNLKNNIALENSNKEESSEQLENKSNKKMDIKAQKKKNLILLCGKNCQDHKILKEIEKFFIFLNTLSLYQLKILNETQPDNNKKNDLPIYFSIQFKDILTNKQRCELNNIQTLALSRFIILKEENNWIMPNNLNIGIIDENKIKNHIRRKTIKFINKYLINDDKEIPVRKTREYMKFQEIINSKNINKELKEYINDNFSIVMKLIKKLDDNEIKDIIKSPNIIIEPIKLYKNSKRKKIKKFHSNKENENNDDMYRLNIKNNYDYDSNYSSNIKESRSNSKSVSTNFSNMKMNHLNLNLNLYQKKEEINEDEFNQKQKLNNNKRNKSVQFNISKTEI